MSIGIISLLVLGSWYATIVGAALSGLEISNAWTLLFLIT